jgi:hypothetical protein
MFFVKKLPEFDNHDFNMRMLDAEHKVLRTIFVDKVSSKVDSLLYEEFDRKFWNIEFSFSIGMPMGFLITVKKIINCETFIQNSQYLFFYEDEVVSIEQLSKIVCEKITEIYDSM